MLGGTNASETAAVEQQLQASVVEHKTFDELVDIVSVQGRDLESDFIPETVEMALNSCDEQWRM